MNRFYMDIVAVVEPEVELGAVLNSKSFYCQVGTLKESNGLHIIN